MRFASDINNFKCRSPLLETENSPAHARRLWRGWREQNEAAEHVMYVYGTLEETGFINNAVSNYKHELFLTTNYTAAVAEFPNLYEQYKWSKKYG